jgi:hypothetical protein
MAFDSIKAGLKVITRIGRQTGSVHAVTRHPISRRVLAVVIAPEGVTDEDEFFVTSPRNIRPMAA